MSGYGGDAAWVGKVYIFAAFGAFGGEGASESFQVPNEFPSLQSDLDLFNQDFLVRQFG
jgi:hypothetical protein